MGEESSQRLCHYVRQHGEPPACCLRAPEPSSVVSGPAHPRGALTEYQVALLATATRKQVLRPSQASLVVGSPRSVASKRAMRTSSPSTTCSSTTVHGPKCTKSGHKKLLRSTTEFWSAKANSPLPDQPGSSKSLWIPPSLAPLLANSPPPSNGRRRTRCTSARRISQRRAYSACSKMQ